jgi:ribosomal protein S18 acetylase RimI-like enzyme
VFSGFVWERHGQIVGNVTISRVGGDSARWMIGNVAVEPALRRQGIARKLTVAALAEIERRGGAVTVLDVRVDNEPAYALYRSLGFARIDGTTELLRPAAWRAPVAWPPGARMLRAREWRSLWWLQVAAAPASVQRVTPVQEAQALTTALAAGLGIAGRVLAGHQSEIVVVGGDQLAGAAEITRHGRGSPDRVKFTVAPDATSSEEAALVQAALARSTAPKPLRAEVRSDRESIIRLLESAGFRPARVLDRLAHISRVHRQNVAEFTSLTPPVE